ncbi:sensor histidine kinase [Leeuwenhoekiella sp. NPDC079379]|uniref:sensor histidine kinase n=1 Tax=Leeuwenhoekiella sp. NPDC079379 TaxID=3364122 RepID=UPI0037C505C6
MALSATLKNNLLLNATTGYKINSSHHVIFWLVYFLFNFLRWGSYYEDYFYSFKSNLLGFPIHMTLSYFTIYVLIPLFIYKRKYIFFILSLVVAIFIMVVVKYELTYFLISNNVWPEGPEETTSLNVNYIVVMMLGELYVISFVTAIKITIDWMRERQLAATLAASQLETELRFLRSQISPHFFFNTLNNIYSLSLEKSENTPDTILKLSDLMRYLLYETKEKRQSLAKEIKFINNYLDLERIRYNHKLDLSFNVTGNPRGKKIAPMLLIHFIENGFKHGANKNIGMVSIKIDLTIDEDVLYFKMSNTLPQKDLKNNIPDVGGIGIENIEKRLKLGYGAQDYDLKIFSEDGEYKVHLKLKLL